jgi:hypothetical protein
VRGTTAGWSARPGSHRDVGSLASRGHLPAQRSALLCLPACQPAGASVSLQPAGAPLRGGLPTPNANARRRVCESHAARSSRAARLSHAARSSRAARSSHAARSPVFWRCSGYPTHSGGGAVPGRCDADPTRRLRTSVRRTQPAQHRRNPKPKRAVGASAMPADGTSESCSRHSRCSRGNAVRYTASAIARRASRHHRTQAARNMRCDGIRAARAVSGIAWGGMTAVGLPLPTSAPFSTDQSCGSVTIAENHSRFHTTEDNGNRRRRPAEGNGDKATPRCAARRRAGVAPQGVPCCSDRRRLRRRARPSSE